MTNVEASIIQSLLDEVERLECELEGIGHMETAKINEKRINEVRAVIMEGPIFDASRWSRLSVDKQKEILDRLTRVRDELLAKNSIEDARHSNHLLQGEGESKQAIIWLAIFGFIFAATLLSLVR